MPRETTDQPAGDGADFGLDADEQAAFESMKSAPVEVPGEPPAEPSPAEPVEPAPEPVVTEGAKAAPPAADADDDDEPEGVPAADGTVPHPKRVSYNKYKRIEEELAQERSAKQKMAEDQARLDERLRLINEALTPQPQEPTDEDPEPDPEIDIFAHNAWLKRQLVQTQQAFDERIGQIETTRQTETSEQQLASTYMEDAQRFAAAEPNFGPAYSHLMQVRTAQLALYHFGKDLTDEENPTQLTPQEFTKIKSEIAREERALVSQALKTGRSPAQAVYTMARQTGYRPQAPQKTPVANGQALAKAAPAAPSVRSEIDRIKNAQDASLSLSHGGGTPAPVLDIKKLADMPQDQFSELLENVSRGDLMRLMGGA